MSINLVPIQYYTDTDVYHYTVDNRPLQNLEANDIILRNAIEALQVNEFQVSGQGDWSTLQVVVPLNSYRNKAFAFRFKIWLLEDKADITPQVSSLIEFSVLGANDVAGVVTISADQIISSTQSSTIALPVITPGSDSLIFTFTGFTGANGYAQIKAEKFGF